ncbi:MAG: hypothetical protein EZS28_026067 [Streblomastix strix]|uniref:Uncharacterized protein n=1 Tax=Streblomastix strix TaxID=222440 RepID=A0A5J4V812_9EUKA|nr:MAG: hypothetical protein EZS28_026067 [Streblomastix strix]
MSPQSHLESTYTGLVQMRMRSESVLRAESVGKVKSSNQRRPTSVLSRKPWNWTNFQLCLATDSSPVQKGVPHVNKLRCFC